MDVELHRVKQVLNFVLLRNVAVDEIFVPAANRNLHTYTHTAQSVQVHCVCARQHADFNCFSCH